MYFFHNVYGDEFELLATLPENVTSVPFGWAPEIEEARNALLTSLNTSVSAIPSLLVFFPEHFFTIDKTDTFDIGKLPADHRSYGLQKAPDSWVEFSFLNLAKPWTWERMFEVVRNYHNTHE
jgi:hypothetical protein